ncbi:MAG TPA: methyltransferase domain-containing protein [Paludibacteraceae bacterium]|nr:methyltransferase domain-containing protein [Paludibacteraceae bacterium]HOU67886.1 methyltransferase domain-containing protein [Paludibacteraceae bacterium]HPH62284.1 methyltransferase domain-containing protein [Paludibacteraceae bacterium]HQF49806.1 methyltransferase domain-containing protein [Paludibacteraceae bacterium]HQJ90230.1 methyltransferase domain-containing protein [Paludibacteraceae bacterium]
MQEDVYGDGLRAYQNGKKNAKFIVESDLAETDRWPIFTFFRSYEEMPEVEQKALQHVEGKTLDVGAGAGSHSIWLQSKQIDVTAIDVSPGAVEVMRERGVNRPLLQNYFSFNETGYDTMLMLMNGIGIVGKLNRLSSFFLQAKKILKKGGRILLDSSDIRYMYEDEDGSVMIDLNGGYYGEMEYTFGFNKKKGVPFDWVFVDFDTLADCAKLHGFSCKKLYEDDHYLYLAELINEA